MSTSDKGLPSVPAVTTPSPNVTQPKPPTPQTPMAPLAKPAAPNGVAPTPRPPAPLTRPPAAPAKQTLAQQTQASYGPTPGARADLIYGATGTTKTSRLGDAAEYIFQKWGLKSRLISADPGGWEVIQALVDDGMIEAFALVQNRNNLYETMQKLCLGWWPKDSNDPQSVLVPPSQNGLKDIGGVFYEGLTSFCDIMMKTNLTDMENINVPRSATEKENLLTSGDFKHRFASQTDYGSIQDVIAEFVRDSGMLPVKKVIWTALEQKGEDDQKKPVYGPDLIGRKATSKCGPWFGNFLHLDFINTVEKVKNPIAGGPDIETTVPKPFLFLRSHIDPTDPIKLQWPAKTRASKMYWKDVPAVIDPDMVKFYNTMDALLVKEKNERERRKAALNDQKAQEIEQGKK